MSGVTASSAAPAADATAATEVPVQDLDTAERGECVHPDSITEVSVRDELDIAERGESMRSGSTSTLVASLG